MYAARRSSLAPCLLAEEALAFAVRLLAPSVQRSLDAMAAGISYGGESTLKLHETGRCNPGTLPLRSDQFPSTRLNASHNMPVNMARTSERELAMGSWRMRSRRVHAFRSLENALG